MVLTLKDIDEAVRIAGNLDLAALHLGVGRRTLQRKRKLLRVTEAAAPIQTFSVEPPPPDDLTLAELIDLKKKALDRKVAKAKWSDLIPVKVNIPGPVCIGVFGDPHVDDDSCDIRTLEADLDAISSAPYMMGLNIGDVTNNWVGRLERKYADQIATRRHALKLLEWVLGGDRNWLATVLGNHDLWNKGGEYINLLMQGSNGVTEAHGARMGITFPCGAVIRLHARHDFPGQSQHNPTHALRRELEFGYRDHILVAGHRHIDGYQVVANNAEGIVSHLARVSGYKIMDDYADEHRFIPHRMNPSIWFVIDPANPHEPEKIKAFWDALEAKDYTEHKRRRAKV